MGGHETMTEKRFYKTTSDIEDYRIYDDDKEDAYFISCDEHTIDCLVELMNKLDQRNKELEKILSLISEAESYRTENSVKEIIRNTLFALDTVTGESANAYKEYNLLNKFFKEHYNEHWDNDKFD